ncbi:MAG: four helix bundle protein [Deltaproteobacteria bacterium]|nr:four helix bundle protein [Deltaproteobacteria bacterium]
MAGVDERWRRLDVWRLADELARQVYAVTREFPKEETYGITAQLRRAALSVPTNIVEGCARRGDRELSRFLSIAFGSFSEVKYLLYFSNSIGYLPAEQYEVLAARYDELGKRLWAFYEKVRNSDEK